MENKNNLIIIDFFKQLLDVYEFELYVTNNSENEKVFMLNDMQGGNLGGIEQDTFLTLADVMERLDVYHNDYIYRSLEDRKNDNEIIPKNDWDLTAKRYIESKTINKILNQICATEYEEIQNYLPNFDVDETISILDKEEQLCKVICQKYVNTMSKEILLEKDSKILHIFIEDEYIELKEKGKITVDNYEDYLDGNFNIYEYDFYKELFDGTIKDEIAYDLNDLALFNEKGEWDFYISFEELKSIGYGYMVRDNYPLIEKYIIENEMDFYDYFSLEQLNEFEETLHLYYETEDIDTNKWGELYSKSNKSFNNNIISLSEGMITYDDFISDYIEDTTTVYDKSLSKVIDYFKENQIKNLLEYGNDSDEGLYKLSSMYKEIMDKLSIKYDCVNTRDKEGSDGKFITTVSFENNEELEIETEAWNGIKIVAENVKSIYENFKNLSVNLSKNQNKNDMEYEY